MPDHIQRGRGSGFGTCGELAQGRLPDGRHFHVTCPINKSTTVALELNLYADASDRGIYGLGSDKAKTAEALRIAVRKFDIAQDRISVQMWSDLDIAKGMGSSTADICAALRALADAMRVSISPQQLAEIATQVESSDGSMYSGINLVDHKTGHLLWQLPNWPALIVVMLVPQAVYSTESVDFAGQNKRLNEYTDLLKMIVDASQSTDLAKWGAVAIRSAEINQDWVPNPLFELLLPHYQHLGAIGINVGHTGTVAGLLYPANTVGRRAASAAMMELPNLIPPGVRIEMVRTPDAPTPPSSNPEPSSTTV